MYVFKNLKKDWFFGGFFYNEKVVVVLNDFGYLCFVLFVIKSFVFIFICFVIVYVIYFSVKINEVY